MKKHLLALTLVILTFFAKAQTIPNGDFENWNNDGTYMSPTGWASSDSVLQYFESLYSFGNSYYSPSVTQTSGYTGSFAVQLKTTVDTVASLVIDTLGIDSVLTYPVPGFIVDSFTIHSTPTTLNGYYQFSEDVAVQDTALIAIQLYQAGDSVGSGKFLIYNTTSGYTSFSIPITYYNSGATPDTAIILISSTYSFDTSQFATMTPTFHKNTTLIVDDLSFNGFTGVTTQSTTVAIAAYPNPASDLVNFSNLPANAATVEITDVTGRPVKQTALTGTGVNIGDLSQGVYIYTISAGDGTTITTSRFVK